MALKLEMICEDCNATIYNEYGSKRRSPNDLMEDHVRFVHNKKYVTSWRVSGKPGKSGTLHFKGNNEKDEIILLMSPTER